MKQLDSKQLGQDLVALGNRLSDIQSDAVHSLSTRVHGRPTETALVALCAGSILGFFLGLFTPGKGRPTIVPTSVPRIVVGAGRWARRKAGAD
jgi:hypothetical protein